MYRVKDFYEKYGTALGLALIAGKKGYKRQIKVPEAERPGLSLSGYTKASTPKRMIVLGRVEMEYLRELPKEERAGRLKAILSLHTPAVMIARRLKPLPELIELCDSLHIALFRTSITTTHLMSQLMVILSNEFAPTNTCHGRREGGRLEGAGTDLTRHIMEIRGIGIINVAHLYGAVCVRDSNSVDIVVYLEAWDDENSYERVGLEEKSCEILDTQVPFYVLPVKPGRDVVLLLETIALNHRLKEMGIHSAKEFSEKVHRKISNRGRRKAVI
jgi:HPr kinase/phosphorylase